MRKTSTPIGIGRLTHSLPPSLSLPLSLSHTHTHTHKHKSTHINKCTSEFKTMQLQQAKIIMYFNSTTS